MSLIISNRAFEGGLSAADWGVRKLNGDVSMPITDDAAVPLHNPASSVITPRGKPRKVFENRDLCRIVVTFIPNDESFNVVERSQVDSEL